MWSSMGRPPAELEKEKLCGAQLQTMLADTRLQYCTQDRDNSVCRRYLIWKNDGNAIGQPTHIWLQPLSQDGIRTVAAPNRLISNDQVRH